MPSWKKVLVSGSSIEVNQITASGVPVLDNQSNLLTIDPSTGGITQISQSNVAIAAPIFNISALSASSHTTDDFNSGIDSINFTAPTADGFGFKISTSTNSSSVDLTTPQNLQTSATPSFASINIAADISHTGDTNTKIAFDSDEIQLHAGDGTYSKLKISSTGTTINENGQDYDFRVEGNTDPHLLFADAGNNKVAIGTNTVDANSLLTVSGNLHIAGGITASDAAIPVAATAKRILVLSPDGNGRVEKFDVEEFLGNATASFSASIIGTTNEVTVDQAAGGNGTIQIGLPDDVIISTLSASAVTASELRVDNDIAIGGNIFSFTGHSFLENISGILTGSNIFGEGNDPGDVTQIFTGSIEITGSGITLTDGVAVTALSATGSFGYLTAAEISSSGHLYAELPSDTGIIADGVVVYDDATGQLLLTASSAVGVTDFNSLVNVPAGLVSGTLALAEGSAQGTYDFTVGGVNVSDEISSGLLTTDSPTFTGITTTANSAFGNAITDTHTFKGHITASGDISASGALIALLPTDAPSSPIADKVVVYDDATGQLLVTASSAIGITNYSGLTGIPANIVSQSSINSNTQGIVIHTVNGEANNTSLPGLTATSDPTFDDLTLTGNATIAGNTTIAGNLVVNGTSTEISTTHMTVEDTFILLGSGSAGDGANDVGIVAELADDGSGTALVFDVSERNWGIDYEGAYASSITGSVDVNIATIQLNNNSGAIPTSSPIMGNNADTNSKGHFYVDTSDAFGLYVYV